MAADMSTRIMRAYNERVQTTLRAVEGNPGMGLPQLKAVLSLRLHVQPRRIEEYVRTLDDAGLVVVENCRVWTSDAHRQLKDSLMEEEDRKVREAKERRIAPLEAYDTEKQ